jgi:hypothetical protein
MLASLGVSGVLAGSACDRECPDFCYDDAGADAPSEAISDVALDAPADTTMDVAVDAPADTTTDRAVDAPSNAVDAAPEAAEVCPTGYQVMTGVPLTPVGAQAGLPPTAIIVGPEGGFWFIAGGASPGRQFGFVSVDDAGDASLGFLGSPPEAGAPTGIALGHDNAGWFDLNGTLGRASGTGDSVHVIPVGQGMSNSMSGLSVDRDGLLWWIASQQGSTLAWTTEEDASVVTIVGTLPVTSFASNVDGFTWYTLGLGSPAAAQVAGFGRALADGAELTAPVPTPEGGSPFAPTGPLAASGDGTMWLLMAPGSQNGWIVAARALDAAAALPFPVDSGLHAGLAAVGPSCGMLVTHSSPDGLTLVSLDGAIAELPNRGASALANSVGPVAVADRIAAVVEANPPSIVIVRLLP